MAQLYATGPVALFVKSSFESTPSFLGHGERAPRIELKGLWNDQKCDLGGDAPFERIYTGETASISVVLNRCNISVLNNIRVRARTNTFANAVPGKDQAGMIGTLGIVEGAAYSLWLLFGNRAKPLFNGAVGLNTGGPMGGGYHFYAAMMNPESQEMGAATAYKFHLSWDAYRIFDPTAQTTFGFGSFTCYDQDVSAVAGLSLN